MGQERVDGLIARSNAMENATMGRVTAAARIENLADTVLANAGHLRQEDIRVLEIPDAPVDTGATRLSLPRPLIDQLGLTRYGSERHRTANGMREFGLYGPVRLTVQGRYCVLDVSELPEDCPVLIGQVPLELMDWVVDPKGQRLVGNPAHGGEWMSDMF
jgi:predicted aspartyl protease